MNQITQFVLKYAPPIIVSEEIEKISGVPEPEKPGRIPSLKNIVFDYLFRELVDSKEQDLKSLPPDLQVACLKRFGDLQKWCELRHLFSDEALNLATKVLLKKHQFQWIKEDNIFQKLLGHLFEQAIRNPEATKEEIDQIIEAKRQNQNKLVVLRERTLSVFERCVLRFSYVWNYNINFNGNALPINVQATGPLLPGVLNMASYCFLRWYLIPKCIENYHSRGINFLINHLPARTFPVCFKVYDYAWWFDWLPWIPQGVGNTYPIFYRSALTVQQSAKFIVEAYTIPVKLAKCGADMVTKTTEVVIPLLDHAESYSELCRYTRELREVKAMWISPQGQ